MRSPLRERMISFWGGLAVAALATGLLGLLRLWRQFPTAGAAPGLLVPFLWPVLALALEAGTLVASSMSASVSVSAGAPPAREGGSSWLGVRRRELAGLFVALTVTVGLTWLVPRGTERPGAFANELVQQAKATCDLGSPDQAVAIPLIGLRLRCGRSGARIEGAMPGAPTVELSMAGLRFSDDLREAHASGLSLSARRALRVNLRAEQATIRGLAPWSRSQRLGLGLRSGIVFATALFIGIGSLFLRRRAANAQRRRGDGARRWVGRALRALPGVVAAALLIALDQERAALASYGLPLLAGFVLLAAAARPLARLEGNT